MIVKPMLAATLKDLDTLDFENNKYLATPKLDGIRALMINGVLVSRTFKPIRNTSIKTILERIIPDGADGEIVCPGAFQATTSGVMSEDGEPEFIFYWFDYVHDDLEKPYEERINDLLRVSLHLRGHDLEIVNLLTPVPINDLKHLKEYEQQCIDAGFEGVILRTADSPYKCGRATAKQQWLLKMKRFKDDEAEVLGFEEKMHNDNPAEKDAFGRTKRSSHQENKRPAGTLGKLKVIDTKTGIKFKIGTGFDDELRQAIWDHQKEWLNLIVKYKHFAVSGVKEKPRHPVFLGVRDKEDM